MGTLFCIQTNRGNLLVNPETHYFPNAIEMVKMYSDTALSAIRPSTIYQFHENRISVFINIKTFSSVSPMCFGRFVMFSSVNETDFSDKIVYFVHSHCTLEKIFTVG